MNGRLSEPSGLKNENKLRIFYVVSLFCVIFLPFLFAKGYRGNRNRESKAAENTQISDT